MKKNLTWKLTELPTAGELADLVDSGVISKEEAREIMFGTAENDKEKIKALEEMIEFLQGVVRDLSKNRSTHTVISTPYVPFTHTFHYSDRPYWGQLWMNTNKVLCDAGYNVSSSILSTAGGSTIGRSIDMNKLSHSAVGTSMTGPSSSVNAFYSSGDMKYNGEHTEVMRVSLGDASSLSSKVAS